MWQQWQLFLAYFIPSPLTQSKDSIWWRKKGQSRSGCCASWERSFSFCCNWWCSQHAVREDVYHALMAGRVQFNCLARGCTTWKQGSPIVSNRFKSRIIAQLSPGLWETTQSIACEMIMHGVAQAPSIGALLYWSPHLKVAGTEMVGCHERTHSFNPHSIAKFRMSGCQISLLSQPKGGFHLLLGWAC